MLYGGWRGHRRRTGVWHLHGLFDSDAFLARAVVNGLRARKVCAVETTFVMRIMLIRWRKRCGNILILIKFIKHHATTSEPVAMILVTGGARSGVPSC